MKKILFLAFIAFGMNAKAQITLEHTYDSAATWNFCSGRFSQLMIINFEVSGERYVKVNRCGQCISIYDMNHALLKNISLANLPASLDPPIGGEILYISEKLFNLDPLIEFMYLYDYVDSTGIAPYVTNIYNEDGTLIFADTSAPWVHPNWEMQQWPVYNTSLGTKMILSCQNGDARVFSLPGTLTTGINEGNGQLVKAQGDKLNLYPNPSSRSATLQYMLPEGEREGTIILYNMQGKEIKRYKVDNTFHDLLLDNTQLNAGTYYYQLQTTKGIAGGKKMIVVK
jgi:hypothetical protein